MTITIKNIPAALHSRLKERAQMHHRSLNSEVLASLEAAVGSTRLGMDSLIEEARTIRGRIKGKLTDPMLKKFKNEGRA